MPSQHLLHPPIDRNKALYLRFSAEPEAVTPRVFSGLEEEERQALEVATRMGVFERPQGATAGKVATALGTSRSMLTRRVRGGEATVFDSLTEASSGQDVELLEERSNEDATR